MDKPEKGDNGLLLAWRYGDTAYSFDPLPEVKDSKGHTIPRGPRAIYNQGKLYDYCPACGFSAKAHRGER